MRTRFLSLAILFTFLLSGFTSEAKKKTLLRLNLKKDAVYEMTINMQNKMDQEIMGNPIKMDQTMQMVVAVKVEDVLANNNFLLSYGYKQFKLDFDAMGQKMSYDSNTPDENNPMFDALKNFTKATLKMELNPLGQVIRIEGMNEYVNAIAGNPQLQQMLNMFASEDAFKSTFGQTFNYFPENEINEGDCWDTETKLPGMAEAKIAIHYCLEEIEKETLKIKINSTIDINTPMEANGMSINMTMKGSQNGFMTTGSEDGMLKDSEVNQQFDMLMKMKNPQTNEDMEIPMKMNSVVKTTVAKM